jgi:hypothetical protein
MLPRQPSQAAFSAPTTLPSCSATKSARALRLRALIEMGRTVNGSPLIFTVRPAASGTIVTPPANKRSSHGDTCT